MITIVDLKQFCDLFCLILAIQDSLRTELERESAVRSETETKLRDVEQALKGQQAKSKQLINGLQKQVEEQSKARVRFFLHTG